MNEKKVIRVNLNVPEELYAKYKIALLETNRRTVTADLTQYMRKVVEEAAEQNKERA